MDISKWVVSALTSSYLTSAEQCRSTELFLERSLPVQAPNSLHWQFLKSYRTSTEVLADRLTRLFSKTLDDWRSGALCNGKDCEARISLVNGCCDGSCAIEDGKECRGESG